MDHCPPTNMQDYSSSIMLHSYTLSPALYLCLVALLQGPQVADEAHGEAAPPLGFGVLGQAVQQDPRVPGPRQQPQRLHLREVVRLQRRGAGRRSKGHLGDSLKPNLWKEICFLFLKWGVTFPKSCLLTFTNPLESQTDRKQTGRFFNISKVSFLLHTSLISGFHFDPKSSKAFQR